MTWNEEQPSLWSYDELQELRGALERNREAWVVARRRFPIGSPEEQSAWDAYREISDALWKESRRVRKQQTW